MSCCLFVADILEYNPCLVDQLCVSDTKLIQDLCSAQEMVELITCRKLCPEQKCLHVSGKGHDTIYLTEKIQSITSVTYTCDANCTADNPLPRISSPKVLKFDCCDYKFPCGVDNIVVCGMFGETMPQNLKEAIIQLALEKSHPGITGLTKYSNVDSISWSDVSINYSNLESITGRTTGYFEIDRVLELYLDAENSIFYEVTGSCDNCKCDNCECNNGTSCGSTCTGI